MFVSLKIVLMSTIFVLSIGDKSISKLSYTYEMLLHYASSPLSKQAPKVNLPPEILRKVTLFKPFAHYKNDYPVSTPPNNLTFKAFKLPFDGAYRSVNLRDRVDNFYHNI